MIHPNLKLAVQAHLESDIPKAVALLRVAVDERSEDAVGLLAYLLDRYDENPACVAMWTELTDKFVDEYLTDGFTAYALSKFYQQKGRSKEFIEELQVVGSNLGNVRCLYNSILVAIDENTTDIVANLERLRTLDPALGYQVEYAWEQSRGASEKTLKDIQDSAVREALANGNVDCSFAIYALGAYGALEDEEIQSRLRAESESGLPMATTLLAMQLADASETDSSSTSSELRDLLELGSAQGSVICSWQLAVEAHGQATDSDFEDEELVTKFFEHLIDAALMNWPDALITGIEMTDHADIAFDFYSRLLNVEPDYAPDAAQTLRERFSDHPLVESLNSDEFASDLDLFRMVTSLGESPDGDATDVLDETVQESPLTKFLQTNQLELHFRGVYNSEGAECTIATRMFSSCDALDNQHTCNEGCLRTADNSVSLRSGYGDGIYAVLDIIPTSTDGEDQPDARGCLVILEADWTMALVNDLNPLARSGDFENLVNLTRIAPHTALPLWEVGQLSDVTQLHISDDGSNELGGYAIVSLDMIPGNYKIASFMAKSDDFANESITLPMTLLAMHESLDISPLLSPTTKSLGQLNSEWANSSVFSSFGYQLPDALGINCEIATMYDLSWIVQLREEYDEPEDKLRIDTMLQNGYTAEMKGKVNNYAIRHLEGNVLAERGYFERAREVLLDIINEHDNIPNSPTCEGWEWAINTLAYSIDIPLGQFDRSRTLLQKVIDSNLGYGSLNATCNLASLEFRAGNLDIATALATRVMLEAPALRDEALATLGDINVKSGNCAAATSYFESAWKETERAEIAKHCYLQLRKLGKSDLQWQS